MIAGLLTSIAGRAAWALAGAAAVATVVVMWRGDIEGRIQAEANQRVLKDVARRERQTRELLEAERARAERYAADVAQANRALAVMQRTRRLRAVEEARGDDGCVALLAARCPALADGLRRAGAGGDGDAGSDAVPAGERGAGAAGNRRAGG